jgi:hypothetical protein
MAPAAAAVLAVKMGYLVPDLEQLATVTLARGDTVILA